MLATLANYLPPPLPPPFPTPMKWILFISRSIIGFEKPKNKCKYFFVCLSQMRLCPRVRNHTRHITSVCVVFCVQMYSFAGLIRRALPSTFSGTAIIDRHSDTTFSSTEHTGCGYPGLLDRKIVRTSATIRSRTLDFLRERQTPYQLGQALRLQIFPLLLVVILWLRIL